MTTESVKVTKIRRISCMGLLMDLLINSALIGMGMVLYFHFKIYPLAPVGLSPVFTRLVGSEQVAIYLISGVPFVIGCLSMLRVIFRFFHRLLA